MSERLTDSAEVKMGSGSGSGDQHYRVTLALTVEGYGKPEHVEKTRQYVEDRLRVQLHRPDLGVQLVVVERKCGWCGGDGCGHCQGEGWIND